MNACTHSDFEIERAANYETPRLCPLCLKAEVEQLKALLHEAYPLIGDDVSYRAIELRARIATLIPVED